jgi:hypothetical protein
MISPPPTANGMRVMGSTNVTAPSRTDHRERKVLETRLAKGIVNEPRIGTRTVKRVMVSIFMRQVIYWPISEKSRISHALSSGFSHHFHRDFHRGAMEGEKQQTRDNGVAWTESRLFRLIFPQ